MKSGLALRATPDTPQMAEAAAAPVGTVTTAAPAALVRADTAFGAVLRGRSSDFLALTKPRLNLLVLVTALGGMYLAVPHGLAPLTLLHALIGTALVAGGSAALNQVWERDTDGLMRRTRMRPVPDGRLDAGTGAAFGSVLSLAGLIQLAVAVNLLSAVVAAVTLASYVLLYTPLKRRTWLSTIVGAFPGALPPVIGWTAATGDLSPAAVALFGIVFCWQIPHFLSIAWLYREDYARAGLPLLPVIEPDGRSTGRQAVAYAAALLPVSIAPAFFELAGAVYVVAALLLGGALLALSARFARERSTTSARRLFFASIAYLPILWGLLVIDRLWL
jgi:protoheme IX farnesyltransferase